MDPILRFLKPAARELDPEAARDRYRGAMLGLAVGNMLGCPVEGFAAADIQEVLPGGVRDIHPIELGKPWDDDVAQAIDLAESLLEGDFDPDAYLQKLLLWWEAGGRGIGRQTLQVLIRAKAGVRGTDAAWAVWEQSGRQAAGNGAVMRCAPVGLRWRRDPVRLVQDAGMQTRATHYDPRCVWTATATCAALAHAVAGSHWTLHELADGLSAVGTPAEVTDAVRHAATATLAELELDEPYSMGYTVKAMKAGLWAFINADSFTETVLQVVNAGGDTDTNGAVAGAVLGARFGAGAIPERWLDSLPDRTQMERLADRLLDAAEAVEAPSMSELTRKLRPVLYLDLDATLLLDLPDPLIEGALDQVAAREGAADFLRWAVRAFEVGLYTRLATQGTLDAGTLQRLADILGTEIETLEQMSTLRWRPNRLDVIEMDEDREWWWVGDEAREAEHEVLRLMEMEDRWIACSDEPGALEGVRRRLSAR